MVKKITSYLAPLCGVCVLIFCDYIVIAMNLSQDVGKIAFIAIYNLIVFLALWAYFSAMWSDPGFVPNQYEYDLSKMSVLIAALYR
jgi:hypothetical protein